MSAHKIQFFQALKDMLWIRQVELFSGWEGANLFNGAHNCLGFSVLISTISVIGVEAGLEEEPESMAKVKAVRRTHYKELNKLLWVFLWPTRKKEGTKLGQEELKIFPELWPEIWIYPAFL